MACFVVPMVEAAATTVITKVMEKKEKKTENKENSLTLTEENEKKFSPKLKWLSNLLWGGSALLAYEHLWHGEIEPFFPFFTAARNSQDLNMMLHEMSTVGVAMAASVTLVWCGMVAVACTIEKKKKKEIPEKKEGFV